MNFGVNLLPVSNKSNSLGSSSKKWDDIYVDKINGQTPTDAGIPSSAIAITVDGDTASMAVPVGGYAYIKNNTHGLADGNYTNTSSAAFPASGGTADGTVFAAISGGGLNGLKNDITNHVKWVYVQFPTAITVNAYENTFQTYTPPTGYHVLYAYLHSDGYAHATYFIPWLNTWDGRTRLNFYNFSSGSHTIPAGTTIRVALLST